MINSNVTTLTLNGAETAVEFSKGYPYFQITNKGESDIYVSLKSEITPETDGTYTITAGETARIGDGYRISAFYIMGTGKAYIRGEQTAFPTSFKQGAKGGEAEEYVLPAATSSALGGVKSGGDITVSSAGAVTVNSAGKLETNAGSATQPVYFSGGIPKATTYTLGKSVPSNAKFTDTTYSNATASSAGLMSAADKIKLDGMGGGDYSLPVASSSVLGGVKSGGDITVDSSGAVTVNGVMRKILKGTITLTSDSITSIGLGSAKYYIYPPIMLFTPRTADDNSYVPVISVDAFASGTVPVAPNQSVTQYINAIVRAKVITPSGVVSPSETNPATFDWIAFIAD